MIEIENAFGLRESILSEIESWKINSPRNDTWYDNLGNFHAYLPNGDFVGMGGRDMGFYALTGKMFDRKHREFCNNDTELHSDLFLSQTPKEFFEEIDKTIENTPETDLDKINDFQHQFREVNNNLLLFQNDSPKTRKRDLLRVNDVLKIKRELYKYALPVYIELRVKGYNHFDLTS